MGHICVRFDEFLLQTLRPDEQAAHSHVIIESRQPLHVARGKLGWRNKCAFAMNAVKQSLVNQMVNSLADSCPAQRVALAKFKLGGHWIIRVKGTDLLAQQLP